MEKSTVYQWRISPARKTALQREARREGTTVAGLLDRICAEWLARRRAESDAEQARLHAAAAPFLGAIRGNDPHRSERVRELVRERLARRYGRRHRAD